MGESEYPELSDEELQDRIREAEEIIELASGRPEQSGALEAGAEMMLADLRKEQQRRQSG